MDYRIFNSDEIDHQQCYRLLIGSIVPRPIAWVSSMDEDGVPNLAPVQLLLHRSPITRRWSRSQSARRKNTTRTHRPTSRPPKATSFTP